jgi:hypothetical protein
MIETTIAIKNPKYNDDCQHLMMIIEYQITLPPILIGPNIVVQVYTLSNIDININKYPRFWIYFHILKDVYEWYV